MSKISAFYKKQGLFPQTIISIILSVLFVVTVVQAATTISTNISTGGTLSVTGASTLTGNVTAAGTLAVTGLTSMVQASSTRLSVFDTAYFGGTATTTISSAGNVSVAGTLGVTGASTLTGLTSMVQASSTRLSVFDTAYFGGTATSTFNSAGALTIGTSGTAVTQIRVYSPTLTPVATSAAIQTTEQTFTVTGLTTADKVFVNGPAPTSLCPAVTFRVSAADTLAIGFSTLTAVACTPAAGTYNVVAIRN